MKKFFLLILMLAMFLAACKQGQESVATPVIAVESEEQVEVTPEATSTTPPLRFDLPTPGAEPVSGWRPPSYSVPWAVSPFDHFYFARPISADNVNWPVADYRYGGIFYGDIVHTGVDIPDDPETPILAAGPGIVVWAGWGLFSFYPENTNDPYGQSVVIRHDFGYRGQPLYTVYAHMQAVNASLGQWVDTGEVIGYVGDTGNTTGPHLHFEVRLGENTYYHTYNPELWISPPQGWGVLVGRILHDKGAPLERYPVEVYPLPSERPIYRVKTYGEGAVHPDPYYNENMVLSDLPAGIYKITLQYNEKIQQFFVEIFPGQVTFFTFDGSDGFNAYPPPTPRLDFLPVTATPTLTPTPTRTPQP